MTLFFICSFLYRRYFLHRYFKVLEALAIRTPIDDSGEQVNYSISLKTKRDSRQLVFEGLLVNGEHHKISIWSEDSGETMHSFGIDELLFIEAESNIIPEPKQKTKVRLAYFVNSKRLLFPVKLVEATSTQAEAEAA